MLISKLLALASTTAAATLQGPATHLTKRSARGFAPTLRISGGVLTSKWVEGSDYTQIVEFLVSNDHPSNALTLADTLKITVESDFLDTVTPGTLTRLAAGQSAVVQVGVHNKQGVKGGDTCSARIAATYGENYGPALVADQTIDGICGIPDYTATEESLAHHWNPDWFNNVKFGIFIHWGPYSAPAYGDIQPREDYAEWYWFRQQDPGYRTQTYQYHAKTYGEDFVYDQFISNFTDSAFDPKEWVDLFADAGAQYIVPVSKHHDGFALFDFPSSVSQRSSIHYGPKRDIIGDILSAAKQYHPDIRRGTYFSMPEWFNPAYVKYGAELGGNFFGRNPVNPYNGQPIDYTGYVPVDDFVQDIQIPQMEALAYQYETELMWCDIGGANDMVTFASKWLNWARDRGRQVTFNNRCGLSGDFDTPEYVTNSETVVRKWETNRGMDPFSFGFNYMTPDEQYLTANDIVTSLVDVVSKNGNFLLDVGPRHDGSIPEIMSRGLRDAGAWIRAHAESIYGTKFWHTTPGQDSLRYTTQDNAFYIHHMGTPPATLVINDPVPWLPGDQVVVLGGRQDGVVVDAQKDGNGALVLNLNEDIRNGDDYVWTFKLRYTSDW